jgi:cytochrome c peroxidase
MKTIKFFSIFTLALFGFIACNSSSENDTDSSTQAVVTAADEELMAKAQRFFQPLPDNAEVDYNPTNPEKVKLGHILYFDPNLSNQGNISCNSCHDLATFGVDRKPVSEGDDGSLGERNSPTVLNAALHIAQFWDGRAKDVEEQAGMPVLNPVEMQMASEEAVVERLENNEMYVELFAKAFPDGESPVTYANMTKAIGSFERQLLTPSPWDEYLKGDHSALSKEQKEGLQIFMDANCTMCHIGNNLGGSMYMKFGLQHDYWEYTESEKIDSGKYTVTGAPGDMFVFKVPSLRNVAETYPYFHDGSVEDLSKAVEIMAITQLNKELTSEEIQKVVAFLKTLTGEVPAEYQKAPAELEMAWAK